MNFVTSKLSQNITKPSIIAFQFSEGASFYLHVGS